MAPPGDTLPETTRAALAAGVRLFDAGLFFEAHEVWEDVWRVETGPTRLAPSPPAPMT